MDLDKFQNDNLSNFKPDSSIGQHLLLDTEVLEHTISFVPPMAHCVEIGPGPGALTERLLANKNTVAAYEVDKRCRSYLGALATKGTLAVTWDNFLTVPSHIINDKDPYYLVGNIPYNISEPLVKKMPGLTFEAAVLLVGQRMAHAATAAHPEDKAWSRMSLMSQAYFTTEIVRTVPRTAFLPAPRTESALIVQHRRDPSNDLLADTYRALFDASSTNTTAARALKTVAIHDDGSVTIGKSATKTRGAQTMLEAIKKDVETQVLSRPLSGLSNTNLRRLCSVIYETIEYRREAG